MYYDDRNMAPTADRSEVCTLVTVSAAATPGAAALTTLLVLVALVVLML